VHAQRAHRSIADPQRSRTVRVCNDHLQTIRKQTQCNANDIAPKERHVRLNDGVVLRTEMTNSAIERLFPTIHLHVKHRFDDL
jgi:hypothetical protein